MELEVRGLPETLAQEETQTEEPAQEEEHYPILPEADELIFGSLAFLLVFLVLARFAFPRLNKGLKERQEKVRGDLEGAEEARKEAESSLARYQEQLREARAEAGTIVEEARKTAEQMRRDLLAKAEDDSRQIVDKAQEEIRAERDRAVQELRGALAEASVELAAKVVGSELDRERQLRLVDEYIDEVAGMGNGGGQKPTARKSTSRRTRKKREE
ncbi:MAG TPA: F0F1 ATP synthase subunit B [Actinomycetota bacterium]|nr:F0F1 ATP synthase subunit B [Actinomycetota bacterium]